MAMKIPLMATGEIIAAMEMMITLAMVEELDIVIRDISLLEVVTKVVTVTEAVAETSSAMVEEIKDLTVEVSHLMVARAIMDGSKGKSMTLQTTISPAMTREDLSLISVQRNMVSQLAQNHHQLYTQHLLHNRPLHSILVIIQQLLTSAI
jgi:hypothetical protein